MRGSRLQRRLSGAFACALAVAAMAAPAAAADPVPLAAFGTQGAGAGQLAFAKGVAVGPDGKIYVADTDNYRISVFTPAGTFVHAFGDDVIPGPPGGFEVCTAATTCQAATSGTGAGQFNGVRGLVVSPGGRLYVSDDSNQRINVYETSPPSFVHSFGLGVDDGSPVFQACTATSTCQAGSFADAAGAFQYPNGLALDGSGKLYVADTNSHRIDVFDTSGPSFVRAFGWDVDPDVATGFQTCTAVTTCKVGVNGAGDGQMYFPIGVALDPAGRLYVGDQNNRRVDAFETSPTPSFAFALGEGVDTGAASFESCTSGCQAGLSSNPGPGGIYFPKGTAIAPSGRLYAADGFYGRINEFDPAGPGFVRGFGWDVDSGGGTGLFEVCTALCQGGTGGSGVGQLDGAELMATDCRGGLWVADLGNSRIQRFGEPGTALPPCVTPPPAGGGSTPAPAGTPKKRKCKKPKKRSAGAAKKCKKRRK